MRLEIHWTDQARRSTPFRIGRAPGPVEFLMEQKIMRGISRSRSSGSEHKSDNGGNVDIVSKIPIVYATWTGATRTRGQICRQSVGKRGHEGRRASYDLSPYRAVVVGAWAYVGQLLRHMAMAKGAYR